MPVKQCRYSVLMIVGLSLLMVGCGSEIEKTNTAPGTGNGSTAASPASAGPQNKEQIVDMIDKNPATSQAQKDAMKAQMEKVHPLK